MTSSGILKEVCDDATKSTCDEDQVDSAISTSWDGNFLTHAPSVEHFQGMLGAVTRGYSAHATVQLSIGTLHETSPVLHRPSRQRSSQQICSVSVLPIFGGLSLRHTIGQRESRGYDAVTQWIIYVCRNRVRYGTPRTVADLSSMQSQWRAVWRHKSRQERWEPSPPRSSDDSARVLTSLPPVWQLLVTPVPVRLCKAYTYLVKNTQFLNNSTAPSVHRERAIGC